MNIQRIVEEICAGHLVITPTDTVYGILADAMNLEAVAKVYEAKRRMRNKPLLILASDVEMLRDYTEKLNGLEESLVRDFLPGELTMLLPRNERVHDNVVNGEKLVGIRVPRQEELTEIIRRVGRPLVSTSANLTAEKTITDPAMISSRLRSKIAYVEDAGVVTGTPSTLVKVVDGRIVILREGRLAEEIRKKYGDLVGV